MRFGGWLTRESAVENLRSFLAGDAGTGLRLRLRTLTRLGSAYAPMLQTDEDEDEDEGEVDGAQQKQTLVNLLSDLVLAVTKKAMRTDDELIQGMFNMHGPDFGGYIAFLNFLLLALVIPSVLSVLVLLFTWWLPALPLQDPLVVTGQLVDAGLAHYGTHLGALQSAIQTNLV